MEVRKGNHLFTSSKDVISQGKVLFPAKIFLKCKHIYIYMIKKIGDHN
jgi:hypothetical protein